MPGAFSAVPVVLTAYGLVLFWVNGTPNLFYRRVFSMAFLLEYVYSTAFFVIDAMTGNGVDDSFFYHLEQGVEGAGMGQHQNIILAAVIAVLIGLTLAWATLRYSPREYRNQSAKRNMTPLAVILFSFAMHPLSFALHQQYSPLSLLKKSIGYEPYDDDMGDWEPSVAFQQAYRDPQEIRDFYPDKNIIHIFMEGLERNYFDEIGFPGVASHLRKWEEQAISFTNITQAENTGWTVAGLVSSLCGIPLITTGGSGNSMDGTKDFLPGATCLSDVLKKAGYTQTFVGGADLAFAGKGNFLKSHGFDKMLGKKELVATIPNADAEGWGIKDDVLLDVVFNQYKELSTAAKPFALYALTLDTHDTHPSSRCQEDGILHGDKSIVDSVRCTDYLLDQFLHRVLDEDSNRGNNTLIIISSDHLAMGYANPGKLQNSGPRRNSFFVLGHGKSETHRMLGTMMDVPATILSLLGYPGKAFGFGRDLTTSESLISQDLGFGTSVVTELGQDIRRQFWKMPTIHNSATIAMKARQLRLGSRVYSIPVLISANSKGIVEEIFLLDNTQDKTPIALRDHSGTTIAIDNCKYFESQLANKDSMYCLFIKSPDNSNGWIRLLQRSDHFSVDLNAVLQMTAPAKRFVKATLNNTRGV